MPSLIFGHLNGLEYNTRQSIVNTDYPLVSIVTPAYNCADKIGDTINTVLQQTYSNWELLIVDDCSKDDTTAVVDEWTKKDPRIKLFRQEKNGGASLARNRAITESSGKFIAFLDGDDMWLPEKLEKQIKFMMDNGFYFSYSPYYILNDGETMDLSVLPIRSCPEMLDYRELLKMNRIGCLTVVFDAEKVGKVTIPKLDKRNDYALWLKILRGSGITAYRLNEPLAIYRSHQGISKGNKFGFLKYHFQLFNEVLGYSKFVSYLLTIRNVLYYMYFKKVDISS